MSFEQISYLAQIVASIGVVVSLIFVGLQIFPKGTFEATAGTLLGELLRTPRGATSWRSAKHVGACLSQPGRPRAPLESTPEDNRSSGHVARFRDWTRRGWQLTISPFR